MKRMRLLGFLIGLTSAPLWAAGELSKSEEAGIARAKAHVELGTAYFEGGRMAIALEEANSAVAVDSGYAPGYNLVGLINMYLRETDKARESFERALRLAPLDSEINNNYGWLLCQEGKEKESFAYFMQAVKNPLYQTPTKPFFNAGICALKLNDAARAEDYFIKALRADSNNVQALYRLAELKYRSNNLYDAQRFIGGVLGKVQDDVAPVWLALRIERRLGNRQAEQSYAVQMRRKYQGTPEYQAMIQGKFE